MKNQNRNEVIEVINEGKIPEDIISRSNSKSITKSFKITPSQNERLEADMAKGYFKSFSKYALHKLFGDSKIITIEGGHELLVKLSECADLLNSMSNTTHSSNAAFNTLAAKFDEIELSITQIFDGINAIKPELLAERNGD